MRCIALALVAALAAPAVAGPPPKPASSETAIATAALAPIARAAGAKARARRMDVAVTKVALDPLSEPMVVSAEVQVAISDHRGKLLCVVSGGAKVAIAGRAYRAQHLPQLRADAVVAAVEGMSDKLRARIAAN